MERKAVDSFAGGPSAFTVQGRKSKAPTFVCMSERSRSKRVAATALSQVWVRNVHGIERR